MTIFSIVVLSQFVYPNKWNEPWLLPFTKTDLRWIVEQNMEAKTIKLPGESKEYLYNIGSGKSFFKGHKKVLNLKDRIDKLDFIKLRISVYQKCH